MTDRRLAFAFPGDLATPTGGYAYDRRMIAELEALGWRVDRLALGEGFPDPCERTVAAAEAALRKAPPAPIVIDGLALGALPRAAQAASLTHPLIALVHHPLARETGLTAAQAAAFLQSERQALAHVRHVVVTSDHTKALLEKDYAVPPSSITVVLPGNDPVGLAVGSGGEEVSLLAVGAIMQRKGYDILVAALSGLKDLRWNLRIVGDDRRDAATAARLRADIDTLALGARITLTGVVSDAQLAHHYRHADIFVLPSRYEGYGMACAAAIAHGLPVIATQAGALRDTVPAKAGILVPPDDVQALAEALRALLDDGAQRKRLACGAKEAAKALPVWEKSARLFARVVEGCA